jgi:hypothetical protein
MSYTLDNFVRSTLSADVLSTDTTLHIAVATAPLRNPPSTVSASAPGIMVIQDVPSAPTAIEIVTFTGVSTVGSVVTLTGVTRGREGTTAKAWVSGNPTFQGVTADVLAQIANAATLNGPDFTAGPTINGLPVPSVTITSTVPTTVGSVENGHLWLVV